MPCQCHPGIHYDRHSWTYDHIMKIAGTAPSVKRILQTLPLVIGPKPKVLDLGCGTGLATDVLTGRYSGGEFTGLDYSRGMLSKYHRRFPDARTLYGDFNRPDTLVAYPDGNSVRLTKSHFDLVVSSAAVSEYGEMENVLPWIHSLLKPQGVFVNVGITNNTINKLTSCAWKFKPFGAGEFTQACKDAGFSSVSVRPLNFDVFPSNLLKYVVVSRK